MFCGKCGTELNGVAFCPKCGTKANESPETKNIPIKNTTQTNPAILNSTASLIKTKARIPAAVIPVLALLIVAAGIVMLVRGLFSAADPEKVIEQTVADFSKDWDECLDFSVLLDGDSLDFSKTAKYFDGAAYSDFSRLEENFNDSFSSIRHLPTITKLGGGITGDLFGEIPVVGDTFEKLTDEQIENDPIMDKKLWEEVASVYVHPARIEFESDEIAAVLLQIEFGIDMSVFDKSNVLPLLNSAGGYEMLENSNDTSSLSATMEKQENGEWKIVKLDRPQ